MPYVNDLRFHDYEGQGGEHLIDGLSFDPGKFKADKQVSGSTPICCPLVTRNLLSDLGRSGSTLTMLLDVSYNTTTG